MATTRTRDGWDRWACLAAAMVMEACGGLGYTFGIYSQHLKTRLGYNQEDLDEVGAAKDFGSVIGIIGGVLYNFIPPWVTVCIGGVMHFSGYMGVYMTSAGKITPSFFVMCVFIAVGSGGDSWIDTAAIMSSVQNFVDYRGTALGVLKSQVGLSGAIFVLLYEAFLRPNVDAYVMLVAIAPAVAIFIAAAFIRPFPKDDSDTTGDRRFQLAYGATIILGLYLLFSIFIQTWKEPTRPWLIFFALTMLLQFFIICSTLALYRPFKRVFDRIMGIPTEVKHSLELSNFTLKAKSSDLSLSDDRMLHEESGIVHEGNGIVPEDVVNSDREVEEEGGHVVSLPSQTLKTREGYFVLDPTSEEGPYDLPSDSGHQQASELIAAIGPAEECTLAECLLSVNFCLLSFIAMIGPGCGLAIINNYGQIAKSLRSDRIVLLVGLISVASCFGRLVAGVGSDLVLRLTPFPRPACISFSLLIMAGGCSLLATGYVPLLYVGAVLVGSSYGSLWALIPAIIAEIFGLYNFAAIYKLVGACSPVGATYFSAKILGAFYDEEAEHQSVGAVDDMSEESSCFGPRCFGLSLFILTIVCLVGASLGIVLSIRTRRIYSRAN